MPEKALYRNSPIVSIENIDPERDSALIIQALLHGLSGQTDGA
jgi:hypothetical protein